MVATDELAKASRIGGALGGSRRHGRPACGHGSATFRTAEGYRESIPSIVDLNDCIALHPRVPTMEITEEHGSGLDGSTWRQAVTPTKVSACPVAARAVCSRRRRRCRYGQPCRGTLRCTWRYGGVECGAGWPYLPSGSRWSRGREPVGNAESRKLRIPAPESLGSRRGNLR
jgi:hypothetical protein